MYFVYYNLSWMLFNTCLALIPVILIQIAIQTNQTFLKTLLLVIWFIFLPNTIYLLLDVVHFPKGMYIASGVYQLVIFSMYLGLFITGFITFFYAIHPFDRFYLRKNKWQRFLTLFCLNVFIGLGLVLGRFLRLNSWDLFFHPGVAIQSIMDIFMSKSLLTLSFFFGILSMLIYLIELHFLHPKLFKRNSR